jgi:hypothetical protein
MSSLSTDELIGNYENVNGRRRAAPSLIGRNRKPPRPWKIGEIRYLHAIDSHGICVAASEVTATVFYQGRDGRYLVTKTLPQPGHR